jgi:NAD(P)-dependent dehydrogenase (short-subunit alcohol dehydrogenase family)
VPDRVAQMAPQLPMRRAGTSEEVGEAIVWLLSERASYTTGSFVEVTGGR